MLAALEKMTVWCRARSCSSIVQIRQRFNTNPESSALVCALKLSQHSTRAFLYNSSKKSVFSARPADTSRRANEKFFVHSISGIKDQGEQWPKIIWVRHLKWTKSVIRVRCCRNGWMMLFVSDSRPLLQHYHHYHKFDDAARQFLHSRKSHQLRLVFFINCQHHSPTHSLSIVVVFFDDMKTLFLSQHSAIWRMGERWKFFETHWNCRRIVQMGFSGLTTSIRCALFFNDNCRVFVIWCLSQVSFIYILKAAHFSRRSRRLSPSCVRMKFSQGAERQTKRVGKTLNKQTSTQQHIVSR